MLGIALLDSKISWTFYASRKTMSILSVDQRPWFHNTGAWLHLQFCSYLLEVVLQTLFSKLAEFMRVISFQEKNFDNMSVRLTRVVFSREAFFFLSYQFRTGRSRRFSLLLVRKYCLTQSALKDQFLLIGFLVTCVI